MSPAQAEDLAATLHQALDMPLRLPPCTRGYGFRQSGVNFIVVEDWRNQGHTAKIQLRANPGSAQVKACSVNDHVSLLVVRSGEHWVIDCPLRPGDAQFIALTGV